MTGLVDQVRDAIPHSCIVQRCRKNGCSVNLSGISQPSILIDMDCRQLGINQSSSRCDYLFVSDDGGWVVPMELKRGALSATEALRQLKAGAQVADRVIPKVVSVRLRPVAVCGKIRKAQRDELRKRSSRIRFRGDRIHVEVMSCGDSLAQKLRG